MIIYEQCVVNCSFVVRYCCYLCINLGRASVGADGAFVCVFCEMPLLRPFYRNDEGNRSLA